MKYPNIGKMWFSILLSVLVCTTPCNSNKDADSNEHHHHPLPYLQPTTRSLWNFVMQKGCDYLSGFVKMMYTNNHHHRLRTSDMDWQHWVHNQCTTWRIPKELERGLIDCGATTSLNALGASPSTFLTLNVSSPADNLPRLFGKRELIGTRTEGNSPETEFPVASHDSPEFTKKVGKLCKRISRNVEKQYIHSRKSFIRKSLYWILDVYTFAPTARIPLKTVHALVGCGLDYTLQAMEAPDWIVTLYKLAAQYLETHS